MVTVSFITTSVARGAINNQISFQGKLTNTDGTNVSNGTYSIVFSLYTVSTGGSAIWTETQSSVTVTDGIFQVNLGSVTSLPGSVDFNSGSIYLGVKVGADPEMSPRILFTASPYAFNSDKLGGISASGFVQLSPGSQQTGFINISGNATVGGTYNGNTFTSSTLTFGAAGAASIQSAATQALNVTGNAASTVSTSTGNLTLQAGSGTISFGTTTTLTSTGTLSLSSGTGTALTIDSGTTGALNIGTGANAKTITLGNNTGATAIANMVGTGTSAFKVQGPSSAVYMQIDSSNNRLYVGNPAGDANGFLLVLNNRTTTGDPTGVTGGMYYNTADGEYRAYQSTGWSTIQPVRYVYLSADVSRTATSYADVTGMSFTVAANKDYEIKCSVIYRTAATATGIGIALNGPPSPTLIAGQFTSNSSATAFNGRSFNAYNGTGKTTGVQTANADTYGLFNAYFKNGATGGTLTLRYASEVNGSSVTVRAGSYCRISEL